MSDLSELFDRDPLSLTTEDIDRIIIAQREARAKFNAGDKTAGKAEKPAKEVKPISIEDLGL